MLLSACAAAADTTAKSKAGADIVKYRTFAFVKGDPQQEGVVALQDAAELSRARYESGLASYIEILTADQQLFAEQLQLAETRGAEFRARSELYRALGGGWQP